MSDPWAAAPWRHRPSVTGDDGPVLPPEPPTIEEQMAMAMDGTASPAQREFILGLLVSEDDHMEAFSATAAGLREFEAEQLREVLGDSSEVLHGEDPASRPSK